MSTATVAVKGRFGYHPCSKEEFLKLKEAHKLLHRAYCNCKRYVRWYNKDEHNRKGPEPDAMAELIDGLHNNKRTFKNGLSFLYCPAKRINNYYFHILREYQHARRPVETPEQVLPLDIPASGPFSLDWLLTILK